MPFDPRNTDPGGMGGYFINDNTDPANPVLRPVADTYSASQGFNPMATGPARPNFNPGTDTPDWVRYGFPNEEGYYAAIAATGQKALPEWRSVSPQVNGALPGTPGFGGDMASDTNINYMRPGSATDQTMNNMRFNTQAAGPAPLGGDIGSLPSAVGNFLTDAWGGIKRDALPPGMYFKDEAPTSIETIRALGGGVTGNVQSIDPYAGIESARLASNPPASDVERNAAAMQETYNQRTGQNGALLTSQQAVKDYLAGNVYTTQTKAPLPEVVNDPRNTGGGWTTDGNSYYRSGDVYTGERRFPPYGAGFNPGDLEMGSGVLTPTWDATSGYLSLENNRTRGMGQMTGASSPGRHPDGPSGPGPQPQPQPVVPQTQVVVDGGGTPVAEIVTLPDGRRVWNIPDLGKNWKPSNGLLPAVPGDTTVTPGEWPTPDGFLPPDWFVNGTDGRPVPGLQDQMIQGQDGGKPDVRGMIEDQRKKIVDKVKKGR